MPQNCYLENIASQGMELKYELIKTAHGNSYYVANTHIGDERKPNMAIAELLADRGHKVQLLHNNIINKTLYTTIMPPDAIYPKHPDAILNGHTFEFKTNASGRTETLKSEIFKAFKQAPNVLIRFDYLEDVERYVKGEIMARKKYLKSKKITTFFEIWILQKHELRIFNSNLY